MPHPRGLWEAWAVPVALGAKQIRGMQIGHRQGPGGQHGAQRCMDHVASERPLYLCKAGGNVNWSHTGVPFEGLQTVARGHRLW